MKCNFCGADMPDNGKFCPYCGVDNSAVEEGPTEVTEQITEQITEETPKAPGVKKAKKIAIISGCVAIMAVLALVLFLGISGEKIDVASWFDWEIFRENDIHKQNSYTVSDKKAQKKADVVVATMGDATLTNGELQVYYQMEVIQFVNTYYYYLSYLGFDYTQPLDEQDCYFAEGYTWEQYFLEGALSSWRQNQMLSLEAEANGYVLEGELKEYLDGLEETMTETATKNGFDSMEAFFEDQIGVNCSYEQYRKYMTLYYNGYGYFEYLYDQIPVMTEEELEAYFKENEAVLKENGIEQDGEYTIDVRHILITVDVEIEGDDGEVSTVTLKGTEDDDGNIVFSSDDYDEETVAAAVAAAYAKAEKILNEYLENPTEEFFGELAKKYTADSNGEDGGLYENVEVGDMVTQFNDWCFDESRVAGDYAIVQTIYGYHIMFFSSHNADVWTTETQAYYTSQVAEELVTEMVERYDIQIDYSKIALAYTPIA